MSLGILSATWRSACGRRDLLPGVVTHDTHVDFCADGDRVTTISAERLDAPAAPGHLVAELERYTAAKKANGNGASR